MKTINLTEFEQNEINITHIRPVFQHFKEGEVFNICKSSRQDSALCYLSACSVDYYRPDGSLLLSAKQGSIIYLPQSSRYIARFHNVANDYENDASLLSDHLVNFVIRDMTGNPLRLSDSPMLICENADVEIDHLFRQLLDEEYRIVRSELKLHKLLYELLYRLFCRNEPIYDRTLRPAFDYITSNPKFNQTSVEALAQMCHIHPVTFRRHFISMFNMSPRQYIDKYFIHLADYNLIQCRKSVAETASLLGFNDVSYFCRFYRKHTGFSPGCNKNNAVKHNN